MILVHTSPIGSRLKINPKRKTGKGFVYKLDLRKRLAAWNYRGVRLWFEWEEGAVLRIDINSGAGYTGGATAYLAVGCKSTKHKYMREVLAVGLTRNANQVPYSY